VVLGLAVLVSIFNSVKTGPVSILSTHGLDITFAVATGFALAALLVVAFVVKTPAPEPEIQYEPDLELEPAA
jgi:hypothetical protein